MVMPLGVFFGVILMAAACEFVDSSVGMGYSTLLSPLLLGIGFDPVFFIPAVLLSQAAGGLTASIFHQTNRNVSFSRRSKDSKVLLAIAIPGVVAVVFAALVALSIPRIVLSSIIGGLVIVLGVITFIRFRLHFTFKGMIGVGLTSAFVEGIAGCGFGPIVTSGQIFSGHNPKRAIGVTTLAEVPICIAGFIAYLVIKLAKHDGVSLLARPAGQTLGIIFSRSILHWDLVAALMIGVLVMAPFGPLLTKKIGKKKWHYVLGPVIMLLGAWVLIRTHLL